MIYVFYGDDRVKIQREIQKILGEDYEVFEGETLKPADIYNICQGNTLFASVRKILIKDLTPSRKTSEESADEDAGKGANDNSNPTDYYEIFGQFVNTRHEIAIWETTVSQKKSYKDFIKNKKVEVKKIMLPEIDKWATFKIFDLAYRDGKKAVSELNKLIEEIKNGGKDMDPYMTLGAFASSALKKFEAHPGRKEKRVLKELSKLDIQMKTTTMNPWVIISSFLLRISQW